jgi:hypothetical protein
VVKNDTVLGGSARPDFVKKHHRSDKVCFCFPLFSSWTMFCPIDERIPNMKGTFIHVPPTRAARTKEDVTTSFLTSSDLSVTASSNNNTNANPKVFTSQHSSIISCNKREKVHYALKSIILDRCSTPELKEELKNEGTTFFACIRICCSSYGIKYTADILC